jgi:hypothetical protein
MSKASVFLGPTGNVRADGLPPADAGLPGGGGSGGAIAIMAQNLTGT